MSDDHYDLPLVQSATLEPNKSEERLLAAAVEIAQQPTPDEIEFLHATFAQVGMPRSRTTARTFERKCGLASIRIDAGDLWDGKDWQPQPLPYGTKPRLINIYATTYAIRHKTRLIPLGDSKRDAIRLLGFRSTSGGRNGGMTGFDQQMRAFAAMHLKLGIATASTTRTIDTKPVRDFQAWVVPDGAQRALWPGAIELSDDYFQSIREFAFPMDPRALAALDRSALALDLYAYLSHRLCRLRSPTPLYWPSLREQFGAQDRDHKTFKRELLAALQRVCLVYPDANVEQINGGILMKPSRPPVAKVAIAVK